MICIDFQLGTLLHNIGLGVVLGYELVKGIFNCFPIFGKKRMNKICVQKRNNRFIYLKRW